MVIYADVLIVVNTIVDYFILLLSGAISRSTYKNFRLIVGAFLGGISSLYIFLPQQPILIELLYRTVTALIITFVSFGYKKIKNFIRATFAFIISSLVYGGSVMAIWLIFKTNSILINNSYVYFDISATYLIVCSIIIYLIITIINALVKREASTAERCVISLRFQDRRTNLIGIVDTGNSVNDVLGNAPVLFVSDETFTKLFGEKFEISKSKHKERYRVIPCKTVNESSVLEGLRCDEAIIKTDHATYDFNNPILLKNCADFNDEFDAIINPEILLR